MTSDLRDFWQRLQTGIAVSVANPTPDKLLGIRDGFLRYFREGFDKRVTLAVVPQEGVVHPYGLLMSDQRVIALAREEVERLHRDLGDAYHFHAASEGGLGSVEVGGQCLYFVRSWTAIRGPMGEAVGGSGSVQLPPHLVDGLSSDQIPYAVPGTRRQGGMLSSLTGGLETRRRATAQATVHALSTLFYGILESRPGRFRF